MQVYLQEKTEEFQKKMQEKLDENFIIPGIVGEFERYPTFAQYLKTNHLEVSEELRKVAYANATLQHDFNARFKTFEEEIRGQLGQDDSEIQKTAQEFSEKVKQVDTEIRALLNGNRFVCKL